MRIDYLDQEPEVIEYFDWLNAEGNLLLGDDPYEANNGLLDIAYRARELGLTVRYLDFNAIDLWHRRNQGTYLRAVDIQRILSRHEYKVLAISTMTISLAATKMIARTSKELSRARVCVGGILAMAIPEEIADDANVDCVFHIGEVESVCVGLQRLCNGESPERIPGVTYRDTLCIRRNSAMVAHGRQESGCIGLRRSYDLIPIEFPIVPRFVLDSGCRGNCAFCSPHSCTPSYSPGKITREMSERVSARIVEICSEFQCKYFLFGDLSFFSDDNGAASDVLHGLMAQGFEGRFWCQMRMDTVQDEKMALLKAAGCDQVAFGIETANNEVLYRHGKDYRACDSVERVLEGIKKVGIDSYGYFMIGLPGEGAEDVRRTINLMDRLLSNGLLDGTHISVPVPFPGTMWHNSPEKWRMRIRSYDYGDYWMNCDPLGYGVPVIETDRLDAVTCYRLWKEALSVACGHGRRERKNRRRYNYIAPLPTSNVRGQ